MVIYQKLGIGMILVSVIMFFVGASLFTYRGGNLNPIISHIGMYSFLFWLPTLIIGIILTFIKRKPKQS